MPSQHSALLGADGGILPRPGSRPQDGCRPAVRNAPGPGCSNSTLRFSFTLVIKKSTMPFSAQCFTWRRRWDSNPRGIAAKLISSQSRYDRFDTSAYLVLLWMATGEIPLKRQYNQSTQYTIVYQTYPLLSIRITSASASASDQRGSPRGGGG